MVVTPHTFRRHLEWLKSEFEFVQLGEWVARKNHGKPLPKKAVAITFDDGWRDNYEYAYPILRETSTPATIFAVSHMLGSNEEFWPGRLSRLLRDSMVLNPDFTEADWLRAHIPRGIGEHISRDEISKAIASCKALSDKVITHKLDIIENALGTTPPTDAHLLNWEQLRAMSESGLIEVGSHTCRHTRLAEHLDVETATREIIESQSTLEMRLERPVRLFCYPNGDTSTVAMKLVEKHYQAAVTTKKGINKQATSAHRLMRIGVHEDISSLPDAFYARLSAWV